MNVHVAGHSARGNRVHQPHAYREERKKPQEKPTVLMCDGTMRTKQEYHHLCSTAHQHFTPTYRGCAERLRCAIPRSSWRIILAWIDTKRPRYGNRTKQNDSFVAVLIGHVALKQNRAIKESQAVFDEIVRSGTAHVLLPDR